MWPPNALQKHPEDCFSKLQTPWSCPSYPLKSPTETCLPEEKTDTEMKGRVFQVKQATPGPAQPAVHPPGDRAAQSGQDDMRDRWHVMCVGGGAEAAPGLVPPAVHPPGGQGARWEQGDIMGDVCCVLCVCVWCVRHVYKMRHLSPQSHYFCSCFVQQWLGPGSLLSSLHRGLDLGWPLRSHLSSTSVYGFLHKLAFSCCSIQELFRTSPRGAATG